MNCPLLLETQENLYKVNKPYQYIGSEYLSANKDFDGAKIRFLFAFPDKYEIGINNLGQKILYSVVNSDERFMADRVYAPDFDYRQILRDQHICLSALESKKNAKDFDFMAFSLQYELSYPTVLEMLELSGIPLKRNERDENYPLIIAGGPCCYNPKPMEDFIDLFMIGDGEELIIELIDKYLKLKNQNVSKNKMIKELSLIEGIYSPQEQNKVKKRIYDISKDKNIINSPVPYSLSLSDRVILEIRRGCGRMCRFCQAGHTNLPVRERKAEDIINLVKKSLKLTGYREYSLLSLSSNDYSNIESVIEQLSDDLMENQISVSLPSQRVDKFSTHLARLVNGVNARTVTLAPEAGSQRLRDVINKNLTEEQIISTVLECYKTGFTNIKLYFMIGLPTETFKDIDEMAELFEKIKNEGKELKKSLNLKSNLDLTCTVSIFVPKPFTPLQWCPQASHDEVKEKLNYLFEKIRRLKGIKINYNDSFISSFEAALSRGDKKYNNFIAALHNKGVYLSSWSENVDKELWQKTALECGFDITEEAQRTFKTDEVLPWDNIDAGLDKEWLIKQYNCALNSVAQMPCEFGCTLCGVCKNLKTHKVLDKPYEYVKNPREHSPLQNSIRFRLKMSRCDEMRYISHLDWQNTIIKMLYRSGLKLCYTQGFSPSPKFSLGIPLPLFMESNCELIDIDLCENISEEDLIEKLNNVLPKSIRIVSAAKIDKKVQTIDVIAQWASYLIYPLKENVLKKEDLLYIKDNISSKNEILIEKINKKGVKKLVNIKQSIKSAEVIENKLKTVLKTGKSDDIPPLRPDDLIKIYYKDINFRIIRTAFFDKDMNEL